MSTVHLDLHGPVAELRLDNPSKHNALTVDMLRMILSHCDEIENDPGIRAVLLTAAESKAFCAGADIDAWGDLNPADFARHWVRGGHWIFDRLARLSRPVIAVLHGHAIGGGLELAAACDIRVMGPDATLSLPEAKIGVVPGWSGTQRLARLMPEPVVKEMALFGRRISADRAVAMGFAAEMSPDPHGAATEIAQAVAKLSPRAVEIDKYMIHAAVGEDRAAMVEALGSAAIGATADRDEGVAAFRDKRVPDFSGT